MRTGANTARFWPNQVHVFGHRSEIGLARSRFGRIWLHLAGIAPKLIIVFDRDQLKFDRSRANLAEFGPNRPNTFAEVGQTWPDSGQLWFVIGQCLVEIDPNLVETIVSGGMLVCLVDICPH